MKKQKIVVSPIVDMIQNRLRERGMSQRQLSLNINVPTSVLNDYLSGKRDIHDRHIVCIAMILGLDAIQMGRMQSDYKIINYMQTLMGNLGTESAEEETNED